MAAKATPKSKNRKKVDPRPISDRMIDAALDLAETHRWRDISFPMIAGAENVPIGEALLTLPSKMHVLRALADRVDTIVLQSLADDPLDGTAKDRLFDVLMRRFDALGGRQEAMRSIAADLPRDPLAVSCLGARFLKSMSISLQAADLSRDGCVGALQAKGLAAVQLGTFRAWLDDTDPGLSATMAALDKNLRRAESFASALNLTSTRREPDLEATQSA